MKILVITHPETVLQELETIHGLFRMGLDILHLRKPGFNSAQLEKLLCRIDEQYHNRIMLHNHYHLIKRYTLRGLHYPASRRHEASGYSGPCRSTSCHSIAELELYGGGFEYSMVSPVFNSISKPGYNAGIEKVDLEEYINVSRTRVVALGGIDCRSIQMLPLNCWGAAVLGHVWCHADMHMRMRNYESLVKIAETL